MAEEINVGRLVAEFVLEAETKKAEEQMKNSAENIKSSIKNIENTNAQVNVDTKQAEQQAKKSTENIKSNVKEIEKTDIKVPEPTINWNKLKSEWLEREKEIASLMNSTPVKIPITVEDTSVKDMTSKIEEYLLRIGIKSDDVRKIMNNCFGDLSAYNQYEKQLNIISSKIEIQRNKVSDLQKAYEQYKLSGVQSTTGNKIATQLESESMRLTQLENQYDKTQIAQDNYVNRKVTAYQKSVAVAESATAKEIASQQKLQAKMDRSNTALIFADLTTSLRTFNTVSPGVVYNIGTIVRQINLLRRASLSCASKGIVAATTAIAIFGTIATLAVGYLNNINEKQEEARKKAVNLAETYQENANNIKDLANEYINLKTKLDNSVLSHSKQHEAQSKLISIQKELISMCNGEADALDLVNDKLDEQIKKIGELNKETAQQHIAENYNEYNKAKKYLEEEMEFTFNDFSIDSAKMKQMIEEKFPNATVFEGESIILHVKTEDAISELTAFSNFINKQKDKFTPTFFETMFKDISTEINKLDTEKIKENKDIIEEYGDALNIVNGTIDETSNLLYETYSQNYETIKENISFVNDLESAYETLNKGEQFDISTLLELCDTYPQLAKYIAETGDLSLANGEKVKSAQKEMLEANIATLEQEKAELTLKQNKSKEENRLLRNVTASLEIYKQQLNEINGMSAENPKLDISDFKTAANELSSAYATLSDGKQLDLNTTLELIQKYPELAKALNKQSSSVDAQREAVENLFNAKKKEVLMSLWSDEQELQSLVTTTNAKIAEYDKLIEKYNFIGSAVMDYKEKQAELKGDAEEYTNQMNQIHSQISAINELTAENYEEATKTTSATSKTNEQLQEQLNLINHRRAMNNLSYAEEISWLQMLYKEYTETAEERMQLEEKIYTAQQNAIKEQKEAYSDLYNTQIDNLEHLKNLDQLSKEQELAWLNTLYNQYVLTAEERMSLEEKIYNVQKEIQEEKEQAIKEAMQSELDLLEHEKNMDRLSAEDEIAWLERINQSYEMSAEDRMSLEEKIYNAKKSYEEEIQNLQQETLDNKIEALEKARSCSKITYEEELRQLRNIYRTQKLTLEQQEQLLEQIRSLQSSSKSDRSSQFSTVGEGVVEALKNKYQEQRDIEEKVINDSIEGWKKWEDETVSAIQAQIDALDDLSDAQKSEDERREYENKRQATELLLKYEKDDYNRQQYIKELNRLDNEEVDRLAEEQREQQKKALQEQMESVKNKSQAQQDLLNAELDAIAENYDKLMLSYSLENEAYRIMLSKSQNEIINFIASYAPEYELAGQTLGEKLYDGLRTKIKDINYWFQQLDLKWQWYSNQTEKVANQAVDRFWASRAEYESKINSMSSVPTNVNLTVNFNEPVESPVQVARKMEEVTNNLVNQLKK